MSAIPPTAAEKRTSILVRFVPPIPDVEGLLFDHSLERPNRQMYMFCRWADRGRHGTVSQIRKLWLPSQFRAGCDARSRGKHHVAKLDPVGRKYGAHSIAVVIDNKDCSAA